MFLQFKAFTNGVVVTEKPSGIVSHCSQQVRQQFVTVREKAMRTQPIHMQTILYFTGRTFGDIAALNITP
jgi:hypothetical protein